MEAPPSQQLPGILKSACRGCADFRIIGTSIQSVLIKEFHFKISPTTSSCSSFTMHFLTSSHPPSGMMWLADQRLSWDQRTLCAYRTSASASTSSLRRILHFGLGRAADNNPETYLTCAPERSKDRSVFVYLDDGYGSAKIGLQEFLDVVIPHQARWQTLAIDLRYFDMHCVEAQIVDKSYSPV